MKKLAALIAVLALTMPAMSETPTPDIQAMLNGMFLPTSPLATRVIGLWSDATGKTDFKISFLPDGSGGIDYSDNGSKKQISFEWEVDQQTRTLQIAAEVKGSSAPFDINRRTIAILTRHYLILNGGETGVFPSTIQAMSLKRVEVK